MTNIELPDASATMALVTNLRASLPDFGHMIDRFGHAAPALRQLGHIHWRNGRFDTAVQAFSAALSLMPEDPDIWRDLASVHNATGHTQQAVLAVQRSLEFYPGSSQSWLILAGLADKQGDIDTAEAAYRQAIALDPAASAAHFGLGLLLFRKSATKRPWPPCEPPSKLMPTTARLITPSATCPSSHPILRAL